MDWIAIATNVGMVIAAVAVGVWYGRSHARESRMGGALERLIDKIMPNVWFVYGLWFIGNCLLTFIESDMASESWSAFGGSAATFALTLARERKGTDQRGADGN